MVESRVNILLVDDQPARLLSYEAILERLDQNLVRATSGQEALNALEEADFAAILLDVSMPGLDGFETARRVREHPRAARTPIIFVTGVHVTDVDRLKGYEMGAADYVYVPVVPEILRGKVQVLVELYQQRRELKRLNTELMSANTELERAHEQLKAERTRELAQLNRSLESSNSRLRSEIDERRRAEELLREAAQRKDEFISILAHELRNPLSAMQGGVELMYIPDLPGEKYAWARDLLQRQVQHLGRLIDDLLDVSRISSGRIQVRRETIEIRTLIERAVDTVRSLIERSDHELHFDLPSEPVYVDADAVRLTQVFANLLTNAAKFMAPGGRIAVSVETTGGGDPRVITRVRDKGAGLTPEAMERIFELFARDDTSSRRADTGLGIGLALARGLVELHDGSIRVASDGPGHGSEFAVDLPVSAATAAEASPAIATSAGRRPASKRRVLVIDDNIDAAETLMTYFDANSQHELRVASDGATGMAMAAEFEPDIVLLDIGLPDVDGYEVARRLRTVPSLRFVPLVAITGFGGSADRQKAQEAGFDRFLVKPVEYSTLEDVLSDCVTKTAHS